MRSFGMARTSSDGAIACAQSRRFGIVMRSLLVRRGDQECIGLRQLVRGAGVV